MSSHGDKKAKERDQLYWLMTALGFRRTQWSFEAGERPDFRVTLPEARLVGIELSELFTPQQGKARFAERRLMEELRGVIADELARHGAENAIVSGDLSSGPGPALDLSSVAQELREHLRMNGADLAREKGEMKVRFEFPFGNITHVTRVDWAHGVEFIGNNNKPRLPYKARDPEELTDAIGIAVRLKVTKARSYDRQIPLWLGLRNPNQRMLSVPPRLRTVVEEVAIGTFERVIVFNDPQDVVDPRPPPPLFVDLV